MSLSFEMRYAYSDGATDGDSLNIVSGRWRHLKGNATLKNIWLKMNIYV